MLVNHLQLRKEKQKKKKYLRRSIFSCMEILGKCILSFFLSKAPNCFYFICGFVKEEKNLQFSLHSIYLIWSKITRKMHFF